MSTTTTHQTTIEADPDLPTIRIVRDFDAPADRVHHAWIDPDLVAQWLGAKDCELHIDRWDARTGGNYRYAERRDGEEVAAFYGSFHEVRPGERLVQTFCYEGYPDGVCLETITFSDIGDGRSRVTSVTVMDTMEGRDQLVASGMEHGVIDSYEKLDALLAKG